MIQTMLRMLLGLGCLVGVVLKATAQEAHVISIAVFPRQAGFMPDDPWFLTRADLALYPGHAKCGRDSGVCAETVVLHGTTLTLIRISGQESEGEPDTRAFREALETALALPADVRLVMTERPVTGSACWPAEWLLPEPDRIALLEAINRQAANAVVLLSAAPDCGQIGRLPENGYTYALYEVTAGAAKGRCRGEVVSARQIRGPVPQSTVGWLELDLGARLPQIRLKLLDRKGRERASTVISLREISFY